MGCVNNKHRHIIAQIHRSTPAAAVDLAYDFAIELQDKLETAGLTESEMAAGRYLRAALFDLPTRRLDVEARLTVLTHVVPTVGSLVEYGRDSFNRGPGRFRVSSWLRVNRYNRFEHCLPEEATHLGLHGIAGAIAPIEEVRVTGMVPWSEAILHSETEHAYSLGRRHIVVF